MLLLVLIEPDALRGTLLKSSQSRSLRNKHALDFWDKKKLRNLRIICNIFTYTIRQTNSRQYKVIRLAWPRWWRLSSPAVEVIEPSVQSIMENPTWKTLRLRHTTKLRLAVYSCFATNITRCTLIHCIKGWANNNRSQKSCFLCTTK